MKSLRLLITVISLVVIAFLIFIFSGSQIYTDWLWFKNLGFSHTFMTMFFTNLWLRILVGAIFALFLFINLSFTKKPLLNYLSFKKNSKVESLFGGEDEIFVGWLNKKRLNYLYIFGSIILGYLFSSIGQDLWKIVLKYYNRSSFGSVDPIFGKDIGFYVFSLPFYNFLREMGMALVILTLIVVGIIYIIASGINSFNQMKFKLSNRAKSHLTFLIVCFLLLKAFDYKLKMYNLLYSPRGVVFGAGYSDIHANLLGYKLLFYIAIFIGVFLLINLFKKSYKIIFWGLGVWLIASIIFGNIYPGLVQRFQVEPNEIAKESEYIKYNIDMTLQAYGLDNINLNQFVVQNNLTPEILAQNQTTIDNIRLWNNSPLRSTYSQLQELRQYYTFADVDIDRYKINGEYNQVLLGARELDQNRLSAQAQTWINQVLKYTHGYGVVMSPVNKVTTEGLPYFYIKDIPPKINVDLDLSNPAIYYGEKTNNYVIVNTKSQEFDYPIGSKNAYTNYQGSGGVVLDSFFKKLVYTIRFGNIKLLLADDITNESKIMYYRNIKERVKKIAPFLYYDNDPYVVLSEGRLYWIQDAYTVTDKYPYSQPISKIGNYIRNSVKVVIDAYNGSIKFYVIDKEDPLATTYQRIFPDVFVSGGEMSEDLRRHMRYPEDLFVIQAHLYSTYHMTDPLVFYNKEDLWNTPKEKYGNSEIIMNPYYLIMELPNNDKNEFILMIPFTPARKNNMVAWMAARSDGEHYGELLVYYLPKDKLIYGPMQIESRIDQNAEISQLLTLWSQRGSQVLRGNLLVIPIANSIMYVEPIYLQAETSQLPELKRIVVAYQDKIVMKETFDQALATIFSIPEKIETDYEEIDIPQVSLGELSQKALDIYTEAQESQREGDWAKYGDLIKQLKNVLEKINELTLTE